MGRGAPARLSREASRALRLLAAARALLPPRRRWQLPVQAFVFGTPEDFVRFAPTGSIAHAVETPEGPAVAGSFAGAVEASGLLAHELAHVVLLEAAAAPRPAWYHEGMAELIGAARVEDGVAILGAPPVLRRDVLQQADPLPIERLLAPWHVASVAEPDAARFYADSWVLAHWLVVGGGPRAAFERFLDAVAEGTPWRDALAERLPFGVDALAAKLAAYRTREAFERLRVPFEPPAEPPPAARPLPPHVVAARLGRHALSLGRPGLARELFASQRAAHPHDPELRAGAIEAAAAAGDAAGVREGLAQLPARLEDTAPVQGLRGRLALAGFEAAPPAERAHSGPARLEAARRHLERAVALDPRCARCWIALAAADAYDRRRPAAAALDALERAEALAPVGAAAALVRGLVALRREAWDEARALLAPLRHHPAARVRTRAKHLLEQLPAAPDRNEEGGRRSRDARPSVSSMSGSEPR